MTTTLSDVTAAAAAYEKAKQEADASFSALLRTVKQADADQAGTRLEIQTASGLARRTVWRAFDGPRPGEPAAV